MSKLSLTASNFSALYPGLNNTHTIEVSKRKALKFATTVGTAHYAAAFGRTQTALALASYRAQAIRCVMDFDQPVLQRFNEYSQLDSTEKSNLSYWIGMTIAAITADELLHVPRLTHASKLDGIVKRDPSSKSLADLVGPDTVGALHVIEAKGRQHKISPDDARRYKEQAQTIMSVRGVTVSTTSYSVAYLRQTITAILVDPPPQSGGVDLKIDPDDFGKGYYQPFVEFLGRKPFKISRGGRNFLVRPISYDPIDREYVYVGLEDRFCFGETGGTVKPFDYPPLYVGSDGVVIYTSDTPCNL